MSRIAAAAAAALLLLTVPLAAPAAAGAAPVRAKAAIVGGSEAAPGSWPAAAHLRTDLGTGYAASCTGTVVAPGAVLTAAHCVTAGRSTTPRPPEAVTVTTGRRDLTDLKAGEQHAVVRVVVHPGYDPWSLRSDVALVQLASAARVPPIALAAPGGADRALVVAGAVAAVAGWGSVDGAGSDLRPVLRTAGTTVLADSRCRATLIGFDAASMLCGADVPRQLTSTCHGDSGGPLATQRADGGWVQIGITSWGSATCQPRSSQVFTRVSAISAWVAELLPSMTPPPDPVPAAAPPAAPAALPAAPAAGLPGASGAPGAPGGTSGGGSGSAGASGTGAAGAGGSGGTARPGAGGSGGRGGASGSNGGAAAGAATGSGSAVRSFRGTTAQGRAIVLRLTGSGRRVGLDVRVRTQCGSGGGWREQHLRARAQPARTRAAGTLALERTASDGTRYRVRARLAGRRRMTGTIRVTRGASCDSGRVGFAAVRR